MTAAAEAAAQPRQIFPPLTPAEYADLRESIQRQGVLHPVLVDQNGEIVDGHHRKAIADELMVTLPVHRVQVRDEAHACEIALEANLQHGGNRTRLVQSKADRAPIVIACRQRGMTQERIAKVLGVSVGTIHGDLDDLFSDEKIARPLTVVGKDGRSRPAHQKVDVSAAAVEKRHSLIVEMDAAGASHDAIAEALDIGKRQVQVVLRRTAGQADPETFSGKSRAAVLERSERIREMAAHGHTSAQIAAELGLNRNSVVAICKRDQIEVPADVVRGRARRIDSNRIVETTVHELEATQIALDMVDLDQLDTAQTEHWTASLSQSIRVLTRFNKRLKEWSSDQQG